MIQFPKLIAAQINAGGQKIKAGTQARARERSLIEARDRLRNLSMYMYVHNVRRCNNKRCYIHMICMYEFSTVYMYMHWVQLIGFLN